ncbi:glucose-1-phosphate adenylyltransferase family protein [Kallotenue papyrolyticum]|uniref:glucose-1-phosphate adenylyltransferase family protein n=1 Tax=Kallotenue papyrolyticum TaxID=1325125 RepID=UPI00049225FD|nr:glucose-1-phosphate adenylyltransferase family protein [Kallotenue papyrolyticum]
MNVLTLILAGGRARGLSILATHRAKPALPFAGKYRIIDFALSNAVNSGLRRVAVLTDYRPQSLLDHLGLGGPWDLNRRRPNGLFIWQPFRDEFSEDLYRGTVGALHQHRRALEDASIDVVLVLSGDQVYTMDYRPLLEAHVRTNADLTLAVVPVPPAEAHRFGMVSIDAERRVVGFQEKPRQTSATLGSMGIYVFSRAALLRQLDLDAADPASSHEFGRDLIPRMVLQERVYAYPFDGYWQDVGTLMVYWRAQLELLGEQPALNLNAPGWRIYTRSEERPPVKLLPGGHIERSLVANGCVVRGTVINSVLSPGVRVERGAVVRDSVIMLDTLIEAEAQVDRCVVDENVVIGAGAQVGLGTARVPNRTEPERFADGLSVIGCNVRIPAGSRIGRHVRIDPDAALPSEVIPDGATVLCGARAPVLV